MIRSILISSRVAFQCSRSITLRHCSSSSGDSNESGIPNEKDSQNSQSDEKYEKQNKSKEKLSSLLSSLIEKNKTSLSSSESGIKIELTRPSRRSSRRENTSIELKEKYKKVDPEMASAVKLAAEELCGGRETESQLLDSLKQISEPEAPKTDIWSVLSGFEVTKSEEKPRKVMKHSSSNLTSSKVQEHVDLFGAEPLSIFPTPPSKERSKGVSLSTWEALEAHELSQAVSKPPENHFQELVNWTNQGKVWKFPIDNEIGLEEEKAVGFHEHIFLERHLRDWCPQAGPIRHFMELVCVGLSKNPHITAERKRNVIIWYKDFFDSKRSLLEEVGALPSQKPKNA